MKYFNIVKKKKMEEKRVNTEHQTENYKHR